MDRYISLRYNSACFKSDTDKVALHLNALAIEQFLERINHTCKCSVSLLLVKLYVLVQKQKEIYAKLVILKLVILVNKVLNMDIFLTQTHRFASKGLYNPARAVWITFIMDGCMSMIDLKQKRPFTAIIKLGRARTFLYITPIVFV
jgi:hypothetical protein